MPGGDNRVETAGVQRRSGPDAGPSWLGDHHRHRAGRPQFRPLLTDPAADWTEGLLMERHAGDAATKFYAIQTARYMYMSMRTETWNSMT